MLKRGETNFWAHSGNWWNFACPQGRHHCCSDGDANANKERRKDGARRNSDGCRRKRGTSGVEESGDSFRHSNSAQDAKASGNDSDDEGFAQNHESYLTRARSNGAQQGKFTQPLADDDGKRIEDKKGADKK